MSDAKKRYAAIWAEVERKRNRKALDHLPKIINDSELNNISRKRRK